MVLVLVCGWVLIVIFGFGSFFFLVLIVIFYGFDSDF